MCKISKRCSLPVQSIIFVRCLASDIVMHIRYNANRKMNIFDRRVEFFVNIFFRYLPYFTYPLLAPLERHTRSASSAIPAKNLTSISALALKRCSEPLRSPSKTSGASCSVQMVSLRSKCAEFGHLCRQYGKRNFAFKSQLKLRLVLTRSTVHQITKPSGPHENRLKESSCLPLNH